MRLDTFNDHNQVLEFKIVNASLVDTNIYDRVLTPFFVSKTEKFGEISNENELMFAHNYVN